MTPRAEELDQKVEALLKSPGAALSAANRELSELLHVAVELRDLPRSGFRAGLGQALRPRIESHDLRSATADLRGWDSPRMLGSLDQATILVTKFQGLAPWERHPDGDELIVVLEGGGTITVLGDDGPVTSELRPGRLFVCPKGLWHRAHAQPAMTALYVTPLAGGEHSFAEDPRTA
ncbi:MAG TPA: cupin domain-containing protein [Myxococcota bacterium]|nr:cupin domain-containing protein [Myxococcota bacterium]